jgi:excinuclease UvrABC nuclease subunit
VAVPRNLAEAEREIRRLEEQMYAHARNLEFEQAAAVRDQIDVLRKLELELGAVPLAVPAASSAPLRSARKR